MAGILVAGLINIETTLQVTSFPINYEPVRYPFFGVNSTVSGVGLNVAKTLTTLGDKVSLLSLVGRDAAGRLVVVHGVRGVAPVRRSATLTGHPLVPNRPPS